MIALSVLGVWLLFEIKDFYMNGGFGNSLAFCILRISMIAVLLSILFTTNLVLNILPQLFKTLLSDERATTDRKFLDMNRRIHEYTNITQREQPSPSFNNYTNIQPVKNECEQETCPTTPVKLRNKTPSKLDLNKIRSEVKIKRQTL